MCTSNTFKKMVTRTATILDVSRLELFLDGDAPSRHRAPRRVEALEESPGADCGRTKTTKSVRIAAATATRVHPSHPASSVTPAAAPMKGIPSLANGMPTARSATDSSILSFCSYRPVGPSSATASSRAAWPRPLRWDGLRLWPAAHCRPDGWPDSPAPTLWRTGLAEFRARIFFISCFVCSVTTRGPRVTSPYLAVVLMEYRMLAMPP